MSLDHSALSFLKGCGLLDDSNANALLNNAELHDILHKKISTFKSESDFLAYREKLLGIIGQSRFLDKFRNNTNENIINRGVIRINTALEKGRFDEIQKNLEKAIIGFAKKENSHWEKLKNVIENGIDKIIDNPVTNNPVSNWFKDIAKSRTGYIISLVLIVNAITVMPIAILPAIPFVLYSGVHLIKEHPKVCAIGSAIALCAVFPAMSPLFVSLIAPCAIVLGVKKLGKAFSNGDPKLNPECDQFLSQALEALGQEREGVPAERVQGAMQATPVLEAQREPGALREVIVHAADQIIDSVHRARNTSSAMQNSRGSSVLNHAATQR